MMRTFLKKFVKASLPSGVEIIPFAECQVKDIYIVFENIGMVLKRHFVEILQEKLSSHLLLKLCIQRKVNKFNAGIGRMKNDFLIELAVEANKIIF